VVGYDEKMDQKAELTEINSDERVFALGKNSLPFFLYVLKPLDLVESCTYFLLIAGIFRTGSGITRSGSGYRHITAVALLFPLIRPTF
jgi:hypothetical protein